MSAEHEDKHVRKWSVIASPHPERNLCVHPWSFLHWCGDEHAHAWTCKNCGFHVREFKKNPVFNLSADNPGDSSNATPPVRRVQGRDATQAERAVLLREVLEKFDDINRQMDSMGDLIIKMLMDENSKTAEAVRPPVQPRGSVAKILKTSVIMPEPRGSVAKRFKKSIE